MKDIIIRPVKASDAEQFINLHNLIWKTAYAGILPDEVFEKRKQSAPEKIEEFKQKKFDNPNQIIYVAEVDEKLVGLMRAELYSRTEHFGEQGFADLEALYIHPDYQKLGIGTKFKNLFVTWAKQKGATKYVIGVLKANSKARAAYEKWGGKLDDYTKQFVVYGQGFDEVFYTYNIK